MTNRFNMESLEPRLLLSGSATTQARAIFQYGSQSASATAYFGNVDTTVIPGAELLVEVQAAVVENRVPSLGEPVRQLFLSVLVDDLNQGPLIRANGQAILTADQLETQGGLITHVHASVTADDYLSVTSPVFDVDLHFTNYGPVSVAKFDTYDSGYDPTTNTYYTIDTHLSQQSSAGNAWGSVIYRGGGYPSNDAIFTGWNAAPEPALETALASTTQHTLQQTWTSKSSIAAAFFSQSPVLN